MQRKGKTATRPDLLGRFDRLSVSAKSFEAEHGLPRNLIPMMRQGKYCGIKAHPTIAKLETALDSVENASRGPKAASRGGKVAQATKSEPQAKGEPPRAPVGRPKAQLTDDDLKRRADLRDQILGAENIAAVDECNKQVAGALLDGFITDTSARVLRELLAERRQSLEDNAEEEEKARSGEKVVIEVRYVNAEWRKAGEP